MSDINTKVEIKNLERQIKQLKNELAITKEENEEAALNYYDLYKNLEKQVDERTQQLKNANNTINKYNNQLEEMLHNRTKDLIKTERHAAFSLLSQGIVHNLKNPLSIISGASQILMFTKPTLVKSELPKQLSDYLASLDKNLNKIDIGIKHMLEMINSLMAKSKSDKSEKIETIDINELIKKEIDFLGADVVFKNKVNKKINFAQEELFTKILPGEVSQIFQNLIRNALDAMYKKNSATIEISTGLVGEEVWFSVKDNGPGISMQNQSKIFDPFYSTKPKAGAKTNGLPTGTGLGLHMCSQMADNYKGRIELNSDEGKGAEFKVFLPKSDKINTWLVN